MKHIIGMEGQGTPAETSTLKVNAACLGQSLSVGNHISKGEKIGERETTIPHMAK